MFDLSHKIKIAFQKTTAILKSWLKLFKKFQNTHFWNYIKPPKETSLATAFIIIVVVLIAYKNSSSLFQDKTANFKCPDEYENSSEYLNDTFWWIRTELDKNPGMTEDKLLAQRKAELEKYNCGPSPFLTEGEETKTDDLVNWNNVIVIAEIKYNLKDFSKDGDIRLANYNAPEISSDKFEPEITIFYVPINSIDASANGEIVSAKKVANNLAYHADEDGFILKNPFSFSDPENANREIYVLTAYNLNIDKNYGYVLFSVIKEVDDGVFAVVFNKKIENEKEKIISEKEILKWLDNHTDYLEQFEKFDPSDFLINTSSN